MGWPTRGTGPGFLGWPKLRDSLGRNFDDLKYCNILMADDDPYNYDYEGADGDDYVQEPIDGGGQKDYDALDEFYADDAGQAPPDVSIDSGGGGGGQMTQKTDPGKPGGGGASGGGFSLSVFGDQQVNLGIVKLSPKDVPLPLFDPDWLKKLIQGKDPWMVLITVIETIVVSFLSCVNIITYIYMTVLAFVYTKTQWLYLILGLFFACCFCCCTPIIGWCFKYVPLYKANTTKSIFGQVFLLVYIIFNLLSIVFYMWQAVGIIGGTGFVQFNLFWLDGGFQQPPVIVLFGICWMFIFCWCCICLCTDSLILFYLAIKLTISCAKRRAPAAPIQ